MSFLYLKDLVLLFVGDLVVFTGSLWLALVARHFVAPNSAQFFEHLLPFSALFVLWLLVFVIVGLYDRHIALFEHTLPTTIFEAQVVNMALAVLFFFLAPIAIQPKTILVLYFVISTLLIVVWRLGLFRLRVGLGGVEPAVFVGFGPEMEELMQEIRESPHTRLAVAHGIDPRQLSTEALNERVRHALTTHGASLMVVDSRTMSLVAHMKLGDGVQLVDAADLYEALFSRVALSMLDRERFLARAQSRESRLYDALKRGMDIVLAVVGGALSLLVYPFVWAAIYFDDRGTLFVSQERVGRGGSTFIMYKFRTMSGNDRGEYGAEGKTKLTVTRVGGFLRKSRIDELPQLWSVLLGDQSLVGPRPELPPLVQQYEQIPYYALRHQVLPGLSGWAQIYHQAHPHHQTDVEETERKLSYDLYYVKHRSLILDLDIALKTMKALFLRLGA